MLADKVRKQSLKKASSPEQLDAMLRVTSSKAWFAGAFLVAALTAGLGWSVFASAPVKVVGNGILLAGGKVVAVSAQAGGLVGKPKFEIGASVEKGDLLMELSLPKTQMEIVEARAHLSQLKRNMEQQERLFAASAEQLAAQHQKEASHNADLIAHNTLAEARLAAEFANREQLFAKGLVTTSSVEEAGSRLDAVRRNLADAKIAQSKLKGRQAQEMQSRQTELSQGRSGVETAELKLAQLLKFEADNKGLRAPIDGVLVETLVSEQDAVSPGDRVFELLPVTAGDGAAALKGIIYLSSKDAYKVKAGDAVQIVPSSVQVERDGYMIGEVQSVEAVPATQRGIVNRLRNEALAASLVKDGPVNEVLVLMKPASGSATGFQWSTKQGAAFDIKSGTTASANFIVDRKRILSFVIPRIDEYLPAVSAANAAQPQSGK